MKRYYKSIIGRQSVGTAVQYVEPGLHGVVVIKVTDTTTAGDHKLFVMDCDDSQHQANLGIGGVEELSEEQAVELAARYQPSRTIEQFNPLTMRKEKIEMPACDLRKFF